jgi:hypothetical protein
LWGRHLWSLFGPCRSEVRRSHRSMVGNPTNSCCGPQDAATQKHTISRDLRNSSPFSVAGRRAKVWRSSGRGRLLRAVSTLKTVSSQTARWPGSPRCKKFSSIGHRGSGIRANSSQSRPRFVSGLRGIGGVFHFLQSYAGIPPPPRQGRVLQGVMAMTRRGLPEPPSIFNGAATTIAPVGGS